jgi:hypothetical protein
MIDPNSHHNFNDPNSHHYMNSEISYKNSMGIPERLKVMLDDIIKNLKEMEKNGKK